MALYSDAEGIAEIERFLVRQPELSSELIDPYFRWQSVPSSLHS
ncbi:MAG: hypothetical protein ACR2PK_18305 [Acidimicrobiales bacterium]